MGIVENKVVFIGLAIFTLFAFFAVVFLGIAALSYQYIDDILNQNVEVGNVNLQEVHNDTFGKLINAFISRVDDIALAVLLGTILGMVVCGYLFSTKQKLWIILDILIIGIAFMIAIYVAQIYEILLQTEVFGDFYIDNLPRASRFILNLPIIITIVGVIIMVLTYATERRQPEVDPLGY